MQEYPVLCTEPGMAEQDPEQIVEAALASIAGAVKAAAAAPQEIALLSFSAAMHSVIALDADNRLLSNSITWGDIRASVWAERIKHEHDGNAIYRRTGTPIHPMSPLCKLMWMRHEKPEVFNKAARFVGIKEYLLYQLFGQWVVDHSIASATGMFNLRELAWDQGCAGIAGRHARAIAHPGADHAPPAGASPEMAQRLGLSVDTLHHRRQRRRALQPGRERHRDRPCGRDHRHLRRHAHRDR
jgi:gluconokinase